MSLVRRRAFLCWSIALAGLIAVTLGPGIVMAQGAQPRTAFGATDLAKLKWLAGSWQGTAPNEPSFYERYEFANDSTIEITFYGDSTMTRPTGSGRVYLTMGRIFHTFGPGRWAATHVDESGAYFVPQTNAHNTFSWSSQSPDAWTATVRTGLSGHDRVTVYEMRRIRKR